MSIKLCGSLAFPFDCGTSFVCFHSFVCSAGTTCLQHIREETGVTILMLAVPHILEVKEWTNTCRAEEEEDHPAHCVHFVKLKQKKQTTPRLNWQAKALGLRLSPQRASENLSPDLPESCCRTYNWTGLEKLNSGEIWLENQIANSLLLPNLCQLSCSWLSRT